MEVTRLKNEWTTVEWQVHQEKVILEEYMEHLGQRRVHLDQNNSFDRSDRDVQVREQRSKGRA
jgi:hypothetical protein